MPEGHSIHRYARQHRRLLAGEQLGVTSPQGRFADGAARLDSRTLERVHARGKHLFYHWSGGDTLHVHLGLFGKFRSFTSDPPLPTDGTRLTLSSSQATVYLAGPTICEVIDPVAVRDIRSRLGPDPLAEPAAGAAFVGNLLRRKIPVGAALLDQKVIAGIGNVFRAELLFLSGIDPFRPANRLTTDEATSLWTLAVAELRAGVRTGRIVTVVPAEVGARKRSEISDEERLYVYKRAGEPCRRCSTPIVISDTGGRSIWRCPSCQPG